MEENKKITMDEFYEFLKEHKAEYDEMISRYRCAAMEVKTKFDVLDELYSLEYDRNPIENISTRIKSSEGIVNKLNKKGLPLTIEAIEKNIKDIAGVRVVCSFPKDIYTLKDCLVNQDDIIDYVEINEKKDYVKYPKESGYRSLHRIISVPIFMQNEKRNVIVEVQLRTIAMDNWASLEHKLRYKKNLTPEQHAQLKEELRVCADMTADLDARMQKIHDELEESKKRTNSNL